MREVSTLHEGVITGRNILGSGVVWSWWKKVVQEKRKGFEAIARDDLHRLLSSKERYRERIKFLLQLMRTSMAHRVSVKGLQ